MPPGDPVSSPFSPSFVAHCLACGNEARSHQLVTSEEPWTYLGWCCQTNEQRELVRRVNGAVFAALTPEQQAAVRLTLFGHSEAQEVAEHLRRQEARCE